MSSDINFPYEWTWTYYLKLNPDLILNKANPVSHYLNFGKKIGRKYKKESLGIGST